MHPLSGKCSTSVSQTGTEVFLAIGSNKGNREAMISQALQGLRSGGFEVKALSPLYETSPVDCEEGTPSFLNGIVRGFWRETPESLLNLCQELERQAGRPEKHSSRQSRELDLDIILFGQEIIRTERLSVPHPRAAQRAFVLVPLHDLAPGTVFPDFGKTVSQLLCKLPGSDGIKPYSPQYKEK